MTLKQLKQCLDAIPEEFDLTEISAEKRSDEGVGWDVFDIIKCTYGEYDGYEKFVTIKIRY